MNIIMYEDILFVLIFYFVMGSGIGWVLSEEMTIRSTRILFQIILNILAVFTAFVGTAVSFIKLLIETKAHYHILWCAALLGFSALLCVRIKTLMLLWKKHVDVVTLGGKQLDMRDCLYRTF